MKTNANATFGCGCLGFIIGTIISTAIVAIGLIVGLSIAQTTGYALLALAVSTGISFVIGFALDVITEIT